MATGKITALPMPGSNWARVRDEYGSDWSVRSDKLPAKARNGDELAYRIDFSEVQGPVLQLKAKKG